MWVVVLLAGNLTGNPVLETGPDVTEESLRICHRLQIPLALLPIGEIGVHETPKQSPVIRGEEMNQLMHNYKLPQRYREI